MNLITNLKKIIEKVCPFVVIGLFILITVFIMFSRTPFWDEAHQVDIARLGWIEILKITRVIGHPFLWYYLIKPFSDPAWYPGSILIVNWLFCFGAILLLWKKSRFNILIKTLITLSTPFLLFFGPVARCYSIGIFFLFLLCTLYPVKRKHPYIFALIIVFCANTSLMAMVGCFYIGLLFLWHIKDKKEFKNILIIFLIAALTILLQYIGAQKPFVLQNVELARRMLYFVVYPAGNTLKAFLLHLFSTVMFYTFPIFCFRKSKEGLFFISGTFITLSVIFLFEYSGNYWNHYFYYIFFIMTFWIFYKKLYTNKFFNILFILILFMFCFREAVLDDILDLPYNSYSKKIAGIIEEKYKNHKLVVLEAWNDISPGADIYLAQKNIDLYDIHSRKRTSYECLKDLYNLNAAAIDFDKIFDTIGENGLILSSMDIPNNEYANIFIKRQGDDYLIRTKRNFYVLKSVEKRPEIEMYIYKPIKITSYDKINLLWN